MPEFDIIERWLCLRKERKQEKRREKGIAKKIREDKWRKQIKEREQGQQAEYGIRIGNNERKRRDKKEAKQKKEEQMRKAYSATSKGKVKSQQVTHHQKSDIGCGKGVSCRTNRNVPPSPTIKLEDFEERSKRNNLKLWFVGFPEGSENSKDDQMIADFLERFIYYRLYINLPYDIIQRAHRVGRKSKSGEPRPIIAFFFSYSVKKHVMREGQLENPTFQGERIYINEDYIAGRRTLAQVPLERDTGTLTRKLNALARPFPYIAAKSNYPCKKTQVQEERIHIRYPLNVPISGFWQSRSHANSERPWYSTPNYNIAFEALRSKFNTRSTKHSHTNRKLIECEVKELLRSKRQLKKKTKGLIKIQDIKSFRRTTWLLLPYQFSPLQLSKRNSIRMWRPPIYAERQKIYRKRRRKKQMQKL